MPRTLAWRVRAAALLRRNLPIYGPGGIVVPFAGTAPIDLAVARPTSSERESGLNENEAMLRRLRPALDAQQAR